MIERICFLAISYEEIPVSFALSNETNLDQKLGLDYIWLVPACVDLAIEHSIFICQNLSRIRNILTQKIFHCTNRLIQKSPWSGKVSTKSDRWYFLTFGMYARHARPFKTQCGSQKMDEGKYSLEERKTNQDRKTWTEQFNQMLWGLFMRDILRCSVYRFMNSFRLCELVSHEGY